MHPWLLAGTSMDQESSNKHLKFLNPLFLNLAKQWAWLDCIKSKATVEALHFIMDSPRDVVTMLFSIVLARLHLQGLMLGCCWNREDS